MLHFFFSKVIVAVEKDPKTIAGKLMRKPLDEQVQKATLHFFFWVLYNV